MGTGYTLSCRKCGYEISGNLSVGFSFPMVYRQTMEAARAGKLGKTVRKFLKEHPDGALNAESVFLKCTGCGRMECGQDLSMYIRKPNVPKKEPGIWSVAAPYIGVDYVSPNDLKEGEAYELYDPYGNYCEKCGEPMRPISWREVGKNGGRSGGAYSTDITCPECGEPLWVTDLIMWD